MGVDRDQIRRDAESFTRHPIWATSDAERRLASHCLTLLTELEQAEREHDFDVKCAFPEAQSHIAYLESRLAKVPALVEAAQAFAEMVLTADTYGCENGPGKCLHADARRQLEALAAYEADQ